MWNRKTRNNESESITLVFPETLHTSLSSYVGQVLYLLTAKNIRLLITMYRRSTFSIIIIIFFPYCHYMVSLLFEWICEYILIYTSFSWPLSVVHSIFIPLSRIRLQHINYSTVINRHTLYQWTQIYFKVIVKAVL